MGWPYPLLYQHMVVQEFSPNAKIHWMEDIQAVRVEWFKLFMTLEQFQTICGAAVQVLQQHKGEIWIADQYNSEGVFPINIQEFMIGGLEVMGKSVGIKKILTVAPKELGLSSMSTKRWNNNVAERGQFMTLQFQTLQECTEWLTLQAQQQ